MWQLLQQSQRSIQTGGRCCKDRVQSFANTAKTLCPPGCPSSPTVLDSILPSCGIQIVPLHATSNDLVDRRFDVTLAHRQLPSWLGKMSKTTDAYRVGDLKSNLIDMGKFAN